MIEFPIASPRENRGRRSEVFDSNIEDGNYLEKNNCSFGFFGSIEIKQPKYQCNDCNHTAICEYCYKNCHKNCSHEEEKMEQSKFSCDCGRLRDHIIEKPSVQEVCNFAVFEPVLQSCVRFSCDKESQGPLCIFCANVCHKKCKKTKISEKDIHLFTCGCTSLFHSKIGRNGISIQKFIRGLATKEEPFDKRIWPVHFLNYFFYQLLRDKPDLSLIDYSPNKEIFRSLFDLISNTLRSGVKTYYYSESLKTLFNDPNLLLKIFQEEEDFFQKIVILNILLYLHLKPQFHKIKNYITDDFSAMPIQERLLLKKKILFNSDYSPHHSVYIHIFDQSLRGFNKANMEIVQDLGTSALNLIDFISFFLKRMLLEKPHLELVINTLLIIHQAILNLEEKEFNYLWPYIVINRLVEAYFLIAMNWNDLCVFDYVENQKSTERRQVDGINFIHHYSENKKFLQMLIEAFDILKISRQKGALWGKARYYFRISKESLRLFCSPENIYWTQLKNFVNEIDEYKFRKDFPFEPGQSDPLLDAKLEVENVLTSFFSQNPNDEQALYTLNNCFNGLLNTVLSQIPVDPGELIRKKNNFQLKLYPHYKALRSKTSQEKNLFIERLIYHNFDEVLSKLILIFHEKIQGNSPILDYQNWNILLSLSLLFLSSKRGFSYFLTGKNLPRLLKVLRAYLNDKEMQNNSKLTLLIIYQFLYIACKSLKRYNISITGHKVLPKLRVFLSLAFNNFKHDIWSKIHLTEIMKIFYSTGDSFGYDILQQAQESIIDVFSANNYLNISLIETLTKQEEKCPCCGSIFDENGNPIEQRINIRLNFSFFRLISNYTYYMYKSSNGRYQLIFRQKIEIYQQILDSKKLCLKQRGNLLTFLKTFYFIERLNKKNYVTRSQYMTSKEFFNYMFYVEAHKDIKDKLKEETPQFTLPWNANVDDITFYKALIKKISADNLIKVVEIFNKECQQWSVIYANEPSCEKKGVYLKNLILSVQNIAYFFYSEKQLMQLMIIAFCNLTKTFISECKAITEAYINLTGKGIVTLNLNMDDIISKLQPSKDNENWTLNYTSLMLETFSRIYSTLNWSEYSLPYFFEKYDTKVEENFTTFALIEEKDYEYFYQENKVITKDHELVAKYRFKETSLYQFLFSVSTKDYIAERERRKMLVSHFVTFCKSEKRFDDWEFFMELLTKLLFYSPQETLAVFKELSTTDDLPTVGDAVMTTLQENIVHSIALSKNVVLREKYIRITYLAKLMFQFMQLLYETEIFNFIFWSASKLKGKYAEFYKLKEEREKAAKESRRGLGGKGGGPMGPNAKPGSMLIQNPLDGSKPEVPAEPVVKFEREGGRKGTKKERGVSLEEKERIAYIAEVIETLKKESQSEEFEENILPEKNDSLISSLKTTMLNCLNLLDFSQESSYNYPNDSLLVLLTNVVKFICSFVDYHEDPDENILHTIKGQFTDFCADYYFACKKIESGPRRNNSIKFFYKTNVVLQLLISSLPITTTIDINNEEDVLNKKKKSEGEQKKEMVCSRVKNAFNPVKLYETINENIRNLLLYFHISSNNPIEVFSLIQSHYSDDETFIDNLQLKFIFKMLTLVKILADDYSGFPLENFLKDNSFTGILFCKMLEFIKKVEIKDDDKKNEAVYFIRPPLTFHLSVDTKIDFEENVDREKTETKLTGLNKDKDIFMLDMMYNFYHLGFHFKLIPKLTVYHIHLINFFIIITENILLLGIYFRDPRMIQRRYDADVDFTVLPEHDFWLGICHVPFLVFAIYFSIMHSNKSVKKLYLHETIDFLMESQVKDKAKLSSVIQLVKKEAMSADKPSKGKLNYWDKFIFLCLSIWENRDSLIFFLNGVLLTIFLSTGNPIWLALPTLLVMYINKALSNIVFAIKQAGYKLLAVLLFTYMCIYIFMWFNMLYLTDFFSYGSVMNGETFDENYCHSTIPCLLLMIDKGIRSGGGIGDAMDHVSFRVHMQTFIMRFFYILIFHIIIILILGNVFLGIIVDSYQDLRNKTDSDEDDKKNNCFICQLTRDKSIASSIDFETHRNILHNMLNYIYFITYLSLKDQHEFTFIEAYAWDKIMTNDVSWYPTLEQEKEEKKEETTEEKKKVVKKKGKRRVKKGVMKKDLKKDDKKEEEKKEERKKEEEKKEDDAAN